MSLLSALLVTPVLNPSHPSSYHHPLLLTFSAVLIAITHPGNRSLMEELGKDLFDWFLFDLLLFNNPDHHAFLQRPTGNRSSPDLSLVPAPMASKCTWQNLSDLGSDHLPISITIFISPLINSISRTPLIITKPAGTNTFLTSIPTAHLPLALQYFLFQKPSIPSPNSSRILPLLPFPSATSIALPKPGGFLKLQTPLRNAEKHSQRHTVLEKTARTILLHQGIL